MKKQNNYWLLILAFIGVCIYSCHKDDEVLDLQEENETSTTTEEQNVTRPVQTNGMTVLGKKLENPYSVENMQKALDALKKNNARTKRTTSGMNITTTHLYVKFIPKNEEELALLKKDTTLILYSYPLDHEILKHGYYYRDPEVPSDRPTYQYCAVKVNQELPSGVEHQILAKLFIPDENNGDNTLYKKAFSPESITLLVDKALSITNNLPNTSPEKQTANLKKHSLFGRRSKWRPAGTIKVWDENIGTTHSTKRVFSHWEYYPCSQDNYDYNDYGEDNYNPDRPTTWLTPPSQGGCKRAVYRYEPVTTQGSYVGVGGVRVRARRWFTTHKGFTDANGNYSCDGRFRRPANYSIDWERYEFAIRDGWLNGATYNGPKKTGDWNLNLRGDKQAYYATIFRAAHHYYYNGIKGLKRPPTNSFWKPQMKIRAHFKQKNNSNGRHNKDLRVLGIFSPIKIYNPQRSSMAIYATTIHELAHASHWELRKNNWNYKQTSEKVIESWARGVEWELTRMVYPDYIGRERNTGDHTLIVADMIDNASTDDTNNGFGSRSGETQDKVSGYTIKQIEDVLRDTSSWENWKNNIKNRYNNETKKHLDELF